MKDNIKHFELYQDDARSVLSRIGQSVDLIFTSPPYNIGSKSPRIDGRRKKGEFDPKSYGGITGYDDNLPEDVYQDQQVNMLRTMAGCLKPDGILVYNHKPRRKKGAMIHPMSWIGQVPELTLMEEIIWDRGSTHNHSPHMFWNTTERLYVMRRTDGRYRFHNRDVAREFRSDIWRVPLSPRPVDGHACPYAEVLAEAVVTAFTAEGDVVCDPYSGSGTTAVAALRAGRWFIGAETDPDYYRNSIARIKKEAA